MELALESSPISGNIIGFGGFQSLFSWNLLLNFIGSEIVAIMKEVSILVFVELALEYYYGTSRGRRRDVSILVFVELALEWEYLLISIRKYIVSILVFVELALEYESFYEEEDKPI